MSLIFLWFISIFPDQSNILKLRYLCISMIIYLNNHYMHACLCFKSQIFVKNSKFRMKCVEKYYVTPNCEAKADFFLYTNWSPQPLMKGLNFSMLNNKINPDYPTEFNMSDYGRLPPTIIFHPYAMQVLPQVGLIKIWFFGRPSFECCAMGRLLYISIPSSLTPIGRTSLAELFKIKLD